MVITEADVRMFELSVPMLNIIKFVFIHKFVMLRAMIKFTSLQWYRLPFTSMMYSNRLSGLSDLHHWPQIRFELIPSKNSNDIEILYSRKCIANNSNDSNDKTYNDLIIGIDDDSWRFFSIL